MASLFCSFDADRNPPSCSSTCPPGHHNRVPHRRRHRLVQQCLPARSNVVPARFRKVVTILRAEDVLLDLAGRFSGRLHRLCHKSLVDCFGAGQGRGRVRGCRHHMRFPGHLWGYSANARTPPGDGCDICLAVSGLSGGSDIERCLDGFMADVAIQLLDKPASVLSIST